MVYCDTYGNISPNNNTAVFVVGDVLMAYYGLMCVLVAGLDSNWHL